MSFAFTCNFDLIPAGTAFKLAQQKLVFSDPSCTSHSNNIGQNCFVVKEGPEGQNCLQWYFPVGVVGVNPGRGPTFGLYQFFFTVPAIDVVNVVYDVMFKTGFDINNTSFGIGQTTNRMGKIGPGFRTSGITNRMEWYSNGGPAHTKYCSFLEVEDQSKLHPANSLALGAIIESEFTSWDIQTNVWYQVHIQSAGGPSGWKKTWIKRPTDPAEVLVMNHGVISQDSASDANLVDFSSYFGGAGSYVSPQTDSYLNIFVRNIYSGLTPPTPPAPPIQSAQITLS